MLERKLRTKFHKARPFLFTSTTAESNLTAKSIRENL